MPRGTGGAAAGLDAGECRSGRSIELLRDRGDLHRQRDLVVIAATTQIDDVAVVRVLQDADEVALAQALAVATEKLERLLAHATRRNGAIAGRERGHGAADQR